MTNRSLQLSLLLFSVLLVISSCKKDKVEEANTQYVCTYGVDFIPITDPTFSENEIIPMHMNNFWIYADSIWDSSGNLVSASEIVVQPEEVATTSGDVWWTLDHPLGKIHQQNDTIFNIENAYPTGCPEKSAAYFLFDEDSITSTLIIGGDMAISLEANKVSSYETPAGIFSDCYNFHKLWINNTIIKPGVGIIEIIGEPYASGNSHKMTLIHYYLE